MNIYDAYPEEIKIDGKPYALNMSFDRVLRVFDVQDMEELTAADKLEVQCALLLSDNEPLPRSRDIQAKIVKAAMDLLPKPEKKSNERYLDFHQDAAMIRSAFFRIGIDLTRDRPHILQFLELLADLPSDTALMRTVEIRAKPIPKATKHNAEQIARLQEAKARVAIKVSEEERRQRFADSLKNSTVMRG